MSYYRGIRYSDTNPAVSILIVIVCIIIVCVLTSRASENASVRINAKVESVNGTVVSIESPALFEDTPFMIAKGESAYKFTYRVDGELKKGWLKDGWDDTWVMDYKK